jgi:hypothetical protein
MPANRSTIFLGDLLDAIRTLKPADFETRKHIAELLGITLTLPETVTEPNRPAPQPATAPAEPTPPTAPLDARVPNPVTDSIPIQLVRQQTDTAEWISEVKALPGVRPEDESYHIPPLEPLLLPQWTRSILSLSLATKTQDGMPDLEKITETLARGEILREVPRYSSPTIRRGIQLLIDKSQAMTPFARDQSILQKDILDLAGIDRVEIKRFAGSPLRGAGSGRKPWPEYRAPLPGTPVVLLTDLGICQPMLADDWAGPVEWLKFSETVAHANCPLVAFVPYESSRWPGELMQAMTIIQWDRRTTAGTVRSIVGQGHEAT